MESDPSSVRQIFIEHLLCADTGDTALKRQQPRPHGTESGSSCLHYPESTWRRDKQPRLELTPGPGT